MRIRILLTTFLIFFISVSICFADTVKIQLQFTVKTSYGEYSDALYFTIEQYLSLSKNDIDKLKQERVDQWIKFLETPQPPPKILSLEDLRNQIIDIQLQFDDVKLQIDTATTNSDELTKLKTLILTEALDIQSRIDAKKK